MSVPSDPGPGARGEAIAALFLESRGYIVLGRNLRRGRREIDLLVERGSTLVAVEVKWRRAGTAPFDVTRAWSFAQRRRQAEALLLLLGEGGTSAGARPCRLDLVTIEEEAHGFRLVHWPAAWSPRGSWW